MNTVIVLLSNGYMEYTCWDYWREPLQRHWVYRRTVDYVAVCIQ